MRSNVLGGALVMVMVLPLSGSSQVFQLPTPPPEVTAASADWQMAGEPVFYEGTYYYPAGPTVFFDGNIMTRTGIYKGIPLYQDRTLEPYSIVYVPVGGRLMRPYEKRRAGDLAGTVGSRPPSWPIERDAEVRRRQAYDDFDAFPTDSASGGGGAPQPVATVARETAATPPSRTTSLIMIGAPRLTDRQGIWIEFEGVRYFSDGTAVPLESARFVDAGEYRGFRVYKLENDSRAIFVPAVPGGLLARYTR
jgi:hypothetical protein